MTQLIHKLISKYPTILPVIIIILQELEYWHLIVVGNQIYYFVIMIVLLTISIIILGDYSTRLWRAPLIGLLIWEILRISLIDFRRMYPFLLIALLIITIWSIILIVKYKIPIHKRVWGFSFLFIVVLLGLIFDYSDSLRGNLFDLRDEIRRWIVVSIPFIIFDLIQNKKQGWPGYLVYSSWLPSAMLVYPIARLDYSNNQIHQVLGAGFWILTTLAFFILIPLLHEKRGNKETTETLILSVSLFTLVVVSTFKWVFLEDSVDLVSPAWVLIIKSCVLLWFPLLLLNLFYREDLTGKITNNIDLV